jgi:hypothetical protein
MMALAQLTLPVVVILAFVMFKLNHQQKGYLFKVPLLISSTALSLVIGHMAGGVMGFYAAAFCDLLLFPALLLVKKVWAWNDKRKQNPEAGRLLLSLPKRNKVVYGTN